MNETFGMNGKTYKTDSETLNVLRSVMEGYEATGDSSALAAVMIWGMKSGRIVEVN